MKVSFLSQAKSSRNKSEDREEEGWTNQSIAAIFVFSKIHYFATQNKMVAE
jgi:hypothetical protein